MFPQHEGPPPPMPMGPGFSGPYPHPPLHPLLMDIIHGAAPAPMLFPPPPHQTTFEPRSPFQATLLRPASPFAKQSPHPSSSNGPSGASSNNIHMIGPIPLTPGQHPLEVLLQHVVAESQNDPMLSASQSSINQLVNNNNDDEPTSPRLVPIFVPHTESSDESRSNGPIFFSSGQQEIPSSPIRGRSIQFQLPGSFITNLESQDQDSIEEQIPARQIISEILQRERAVPNPVPIQPRHHIQHVIRPRRSIDVVENEAKMETIAVEKKQHRVKRCACDCACKNHNPLKE